MKNTRVLILTAVLLSCFGAAQTAVAKEIALQDGMGSFVVPDDFTPLTEEEIQTRFSKGPPPAFVVGNEGRVATIAYEVKNLPMTPAQLPQGLAATAATFDRAVPGIQWKEKKIVKMAGQDWALMEFVAPGGSIGKDFHSIILITPCKGRFVLFNFNAMENEFAGLEKALRDSIASIKLS